MADEQPQKVDQTGKKKIRRVKKKPAAAEQMQDAAQVVQRPVKRHPLSFDDIQHYDYIREATSKNVW